MANHRELAQLLYANALGRTSAARILRTVVVAGAMLGAPLAVPDALAQAVPQRMHPPPSPPQPPKPATYDDAIAAARDTQAAVDKLVQEESELGAKIKAATDAVAAATSDAERKTAKAELTALQKTRADLPVRLTAATVTAAGAAKAVVAKVQEELTAFAAKLDAAIKSTEAAQSDADRKAAQAKLEMLRKEKAELERRIAEAKATAAKAERQRAQRARRPRPTDDRPTGRGFILS